MRFLFCLISLAIFSYQVAAQADTITLSTDQEPKLEGMRSVRITEVIDLRSDTLSIGFTNKGLKLVSLTLVGGVGKAFALYIASVQPHVSKNATPVTLVIKTLWVSEEMAGLQEVAKLRIDLEFYRLDGQEYNLAFRFNRDYETKAFDVTSKHQRNITQAMRDAFTEFTETIKSSSGTITENNHLYPILTASAPARGIYRSFEEFRNNTPGIKRDLEVQQRSHSARVWFNTVESQPYYLDENGKRIKIKDAIWGFSDGKKMYIRHEREYFELTRIENIFTFYAYSAMNKLAYGTPSAFTGGMPPDVQYALDLETGKEVEIK